MNVMFTFAGRGKKSTESLLWCDQEDDELSTLCCLPRIITEHLIMQDDNV